LALKNKNSWQFSAGVETTVLLALKTNVCSVLVVPLSAIMAIIFFYFQFSLCLFPSC
jgi:hypothetical protein